MTLEIITADVLAPIRHGFFTRRGGASSGVYSGLNCGGGSDDQNDAVEINRNRVADALGLSSRDLVTVHQVHSPDVVEVSGPLEGARPRADALVTATPGVALAILTADCGPVLFADHEAGVIGAAHAGWRGAFEGVVENTVLAMEQLGAVRCRISAALGPSISQANYEVGPEFIERFLERDPSFDRYFTPSDTYGHAMFDLRQMTLDRMRSAGLNATMLPQCTYADEQAWYSYRRATHCNETDYGRQISAITIKEDAHGPAF